MLAVARVEYFGRTVNVAARIADFARFGEVLVSEDAARSAELDGVDLRPIGPVALKGLRDGVVLAPAVRSESA